jgi:hypothetical protein
MLEQIPCLEVAGQGPPLSLFLPLVALALLLSCILSLSPSRSVILKHPLYIEFVVVLTALCRAQQLAHSRQRINDGVGQSCRATLRRTSASGLGIAEAKEQPPHFSECLLPFGYALMFALLPCCALEIGHVVIDSWIALWLTGLPR